MTKRAILYARVSGDDRKYATSGIDSQLADCRRYASERGYQVVGEVYETPDKFTSGADWLPELDRVLKLAQGGGFDVLIVREIDRLARNRFKQMSVEIQLESCGARVEYVIGQFEESAEGRLLKGLMSEFAEYEREKIKERMVRGRIRSVQAGNVTTGINAPYGYNLVTENGRRVLVRNEEQAVVIRHIFDLYVNQGKSITSIMRYLSDRRIPKPCSGKEHITTNKSHIWSSATVHNILDNECYIGRWYYRKTKTVKTPQGRYKKMPRPREEWLEIEVPPILDEAIFRAAQRQRDLNKRLKGKQHNRFYLLGGMVKCGHCGYTAVGITRASNGKPHGYSYYFCSVCHVPGRRPVTCDNNHLYPVARADRRVWAFVKSVYMSPEVLQESLDNYQAQQADAQRPQLEMIEATAARLVQAEQEKARLVKAYASGVLSLEEIATTKTELDRRLNDLTQTLAVLKAELPATALTQEEIDKIQRDAADLRQGIARADNDPTEQRRILELLQFEGRLFIEDGQEYIDVNCILGPARLSLSADSTFIR